MNYGIGSLNTHYAFCCL